MVIIRPRTQIFVAVENPERESYIVTVIGTGRGEVLATTSSGIRVRFPAASVRYLNGTPLVIEDVVHTF